MDRVARNNVKSIRMSAVEARLLEESARQRNMSISDVLRDAFILWREQMGDRRGSMDAWVAGLLERHGSEARLTARLNSVFSLDAEINGEELHAFYAEAVFDGHNQVQVWVGDGDSDARAYLGRLQVIEGASITVPVKALPTMSESDAHAV